MDFRIVWGEDKGLSDVYRRNTQQVNNDPVLYASEADVQMPQGSKTAGSAQAEIEAFIIATFKENGQKMVNIARCESSLNPNAVNWKDAEITGMPSMGIFQINAPYNTDYFDWRFNVEVAKEMFDRRGLQPWSCAKKLGYL